MYARASIYVHAYLVNSRLQVLQRHKVQIILNRINDGRDRHLDQLLGFPYELHLDLRNHRLQLEMMLSEQEHDGKTEFGGLGQDNDGGGKVHRMILGRTREPHEQRVRRPNDGHRDNYICLEAARHGLLFDDRSNDGFILAHFNVSHYVKVTLGSVIFCIAGYSTTFPANAYDGAVLKR